MKAVGSAEVTTRESVFVLIYSFSVEIKEEECFTRSDGAFLTSGSSFVVLTFELDFLCFLVPFKCCFSSSFMPHKTAACTKETKTRINAVVE